MSAKKIIGFGFGFLVFAFLILPGVMGNQIEQKTVDYFENLYKTTSYQVLSVSFEKGWFSSTVTIELEIPKNYLNSILENPDDYDGNKEKLGLSFRVDHGPFIFKKFRFGLASFSGEYSMFLAPPSVLKAPFNDVPVLHTEGVINYDGSVTMVMSMPAFEVPLNKFPALEQTNPEAPPTIMKVDEIRLEFEVTVKEGVLNLIIVPFDLKFSMTTQNDQTMEFKIEGFSADSFYLIGVPYPINYDRGTTSLASLGFSFNQNRFVMENFKSADSIIRTANNPLLDVISQFQIGQTGYFTENDENLDPQVKSTSGTVELLNINGEAVVDLLDVMAEMPAQPSEEDTAKVLTQLQNLLGAGLEYNIPSLKVETQWGNIHYTQHIVFPALEFSEPFDALVFVQKVYYSGNFTFDEEFIEAMVEKMIQGQLKTADQEVDDATFETIKANTIQQFINAGFLIKEETGYSMALEMKDGVFTVNGTPQDLLGLVQSQI